MKTLLVCSAYILFPCLSACAFFLLTVMSDSANALNRNSDQTSLGLMDLEV